MIPKKIHYCWFGGAEIPEHDQKCIDSWKNYCPDYEIIRWDESNYNYKKNQYMSQAYEAKKWGFVTDYARLDIIYENGGVYFDTDVELVRNIDDLLDNQAFMGFDASGESVASGLGLGAEEHFPLYREMLQEIYGKRVFKLGIGDYDTTPCPRLTDDFLKKRGLLQNNCIQNVMGLTIYPSEWLCPIDDVTGDFCTTENTHSIHHFHASWLTPEEKKKNI